MRMEAEAGAPVLKIKYRALANVQAAESRPAAEGSANSHLVKDGVLQSVADTIESRMSSLMDFCVQNGCDLVGVKKMLYQRRYNDYLAFKDTALSVLKVKYDIKIESVR